MGVALAYPAVSAMDEKFRSLIAGDVATGVDCILLGSVNGRCSLTTGTTDGPPVLVRDYVLITLSHIKPLGSTLLLPTSPGSIRH